MQERVEELGKNLWADDLVIIDMRALVLSLRKELVLYRNKT